MYSRLYTNIHSVSNIYIHLPFCQRKCHFCAFPIHALPNVNTEHSKQMFQNYTRTLISEIEFSQKFTSFSSPLESIYLGGGTPSLFAPELIKQILESLRIGKSTGIEITLESNLSQIAQLSKFQALGINRFSIGVQTFDREQLISLNRISESEKWEFGRILEKLKKHRPSKKINLDFILDLSPKMEDFKHILIAIDEILPEHITIYLLEINEGSFLHKNQKYFSKLLQNSDQIIQKYLNLCKMLTQRGYDHYEVSNFAKKCKDSQNHSIHNSNYWTGNKQFAAYGMGASSLIAGCRITRPHTLSKYYTFVENLRIKTETDGKLQNLSIHEEISLEPILESVIMSRLRKKQGLKWKEIEQIIKDLNLSNQELFASVKKDMKKIVNEINNEKGGIVQQTDNGIVLVIPEGFLFADEVAFRLLNSLNALFRQSART